jgi:hypothetical protein
MGLLRVRYGSVRGEGAGESLPSDIEIFLESPLEAAILKVDVKVPKEIVRGSKDGV